jgi:hypothetical protein
MEWKSIAAGRKKSLLMACLRSPAKDAHQNAITTGTIIHNNDAGTAAEMLE